MVHGNNLTRDPAMSASPEHPRHSEKVAATVGANLARPEVVIRSLSILR